MMYDHEIIGRAAARKALTAARGESVPLPRVGYEILLQVCAVPVADYWGAERHLYLRNESGRYGIVPILLLPTAQLSPGVRNAE
jgi:hypothetical protein